MKTKRAGFKPALCYKSQFVLRPVRSTTAIFPIRPEPVATGPYFVIFVPLSLNCFASHRAFFARRGDLSVAPADYGLQNLVGMLAQ